LPHDVQELLKSFFQSRREIENISKSVRDGTANNKVDNKVTELKANLQDVAKSTSKLQRATQESLHESHVAIAVTEDVARMLHSAHTLLLPSQIEDAHQLATVRPPPLALARKLCAVQEKMKRITAGIAEANTITENRDKAEQSMRHPAAETFSDWTSNDINALLNDIENQYTLVQRMIAFLQSEVASLEDQQSFETSGISLDSAEGELDVSFQELRVSDAPYDDNNNTSAERAFSDHPAEEADHHSPIRRPPSLPASPVPRPGVRFAVHSKVTARSSAWDKLRANVKNSKRPTYSLDLFEHVLECAEDQKDNEGRVPSSKARLSGIFKQHGAAYRQLRSHHGHDDQDQHRNDVLLSESSPVKRQPFYVSADSPGDWRHIQPYVAPATTPGSGHVGSTASGGDSAAVFPPPGYVSPLAGAMQHILKYVERQPKTPAPVTTSTTAFALSSQLPQSGSAVSSGLGFGSSAGAPQEGGFGGTTLVPRRSRDSKPLEDTPAPGQRPPLTGGLGQRPRSGSSTTMEGHGGTLPPPPGGSPPGNLSHLQCACSFSERCDFTGCLRSNSAVVSSSCVVSSRVLYCFLLTTW
jgi:hypothetical protein